MEISLLGLVVWSLLFQPRLMFWASHVRQNCHNGSYEISVLMMNNSAFPESLENLKEAVNVGLDVVRMQLHEAGKNMVIESFCVTIPGDKR
jgi:heat-stable enterotoxin receptor